MFCSSCGKEIMDCSALCPLCGEAKKKSPLLAKPIHKSWWFWTLIGAVVIAIVILMAINLNKDAMKRRDKFDFTGPMIGGESIVMVRLTDEGRDIWNKHTIKEQIIISKNEIFYIAENAILDADKAGYEAQRYVISPFCFIYDREEKIIEIYGNDKYYQYNKGGWSEAFGETHIKCSSEESEKLYMQLMGCSKEEIFYFYEIELKDLEKY